MFKVEEFGTDFKSDYQFKNGDLDIISDKENITQAIINRLNAHEGVYDLFYDAYGGLLSSFFGWKKVNSTLDFIKLEIINILTQDPRLTDFDIELEYTKNGNISIKLDLSYTEYSDLSLSLVISDSGIVEEEE